MEKSCGIVLLLFCSRPLDQREGDLVYIEGPVTKEDVATVIQIEFERGNLSLEECCALSNEVSRREDIPDSLLGELTATLEVHHGVIRAEGCSVELTHAAS